MKKTILVQSFILFLFHLHVVEARDVMKLWANQTKPYYKQNSLVEIESIVWGTPCAANVTEPTLTIYRARGRNTGFGVVIIPGGNYSVVAIHHEGYEVAEIMAKQGVTVAVLKYRLPNPKSSDEPGLVPLADARKALKILRQQSGKYGIDTKKVGVVGFSAGSHLATVASA
jgi:acetyl esterase/lipase